MPARSSDLILPRLLICEGPEDVAFFRQLIEVRGLPRFHIRDTADKQGGGGGNTKFGTALSALSANRRFHTIRDIILVTDADQDQAGSFATVQRQIREAGIGAPPDRLNEPSVGHPRITVITIPLDEKSGTLESVCIPAARRAERLLSDRVDSFANTLATADWPPVRRDKFWLRCFLAGRAPDPFIPLGRSFGDNGVPGLIPVGDRCFDDIAGLLARYADDPPPTMREDGGSLPAGGQRTRHDRQRPRPRPRKP